MTFKVETTNGGVPEMVVHVNEYWDVYVCTFGWPDDADNIPSIEYSIRPLGRQRAVPTTVLDAVNAAFAAIDVPVVNERYYTYYFLVHVLARYARKQELGELVARTLLELGDAAMGEEAQP